MSTAHFGLYGQGVLIDQPKPFTLKAFGQINDQGIGNTRKQPIATPSFPNHVRSGHENNNFVSVNRDINHYNNRQQRSNAIVDEALAVFKSNNIQYKFSKPSNTARHQRFEQALAGLTQMLRGKMPPDLTRAVSLVENAYDPSVKYDDLKQQVQNLARLSAYVLQSKGLKADDNLSKIMAVFHVMADTTTVKSNGSEFEQTFYPMLYDFDDPWGRQDYSKMFVSKLLRFGTGNCTSLPRLFLMIAEEMDIEASLAFAPNHSYIKFQDQYGEWHNIELTNQMLTSDDIIMESGWIKSEAIRSGIYMTPLTKKQVIAQSINELGLAHQKIFGSTEFVLRCANWALEYNPKSITALQIKANYYTNLLYYITKQYQDQQRSENEFTNDRKVRMLKTKMDVTYQQIDDLGYTEIPEEIYAQWLEAMDNEGNKQSSRNQQRQLLNSINR